MLKQRLLDGWPARRECLRHLACSCQSQRVGPVRVPESVKGAPTPASTVERPIEVLSRRLVRRNLLDLRCEHVFGRFEIKTRLNVHPERSAGLEELSEPQRVPHLVRGHRAS